MSGVIHTMSESITLSEQQDQLRGSVSAFVGCMFSGKTTKLLNRLDASSANEFVVCKHIIDDRYRADAIVSHGGKSCEAVSVQSAQEILSNVTPNTQLVAIDEAHFFDESLVEIVESLSAHNVDVMFTALDRDSWSRSFVVVEKLCAMAVELIVLQATCAKCQKTADRTQRLTPIIAGCMVGGAESYEPRCQSCWNPPPESPPD